MKKISTKIIVLSVVNTTVIAILNVAMSIYMNNTQSGTAAMNTTGVEPVVKSGILTFLPPTPILIGLGASLILGAFMAYLLGQYISKPIVKVTELTRRTAIFDLVEDDSIEELYRYKDESGDMAKALGATRKALKNMADKFQQISTALGRSSQNLSTVADEELFLLAGDLEAETRRFQTE